jgi:putative glycosyltransferase (TIGR04372 family)
MVNTLQLALQAACNHDLFIPKLFLSRKSGRLLTITESLENFGTAWASEPGDLTPLGVDLIDNTPQEIEAVVCEMIDRLDGVAVDIAPWEEAAQQRLRELRIPSSINHTHGPIVAGKTRMGRDFLHRNAFALGLSGIQAT